MLAGLIAIEDLDQPEHGCSMSSSSQAEPRHSEHLVGLNTVTPRRWGSTLVSGQPARLPLDCPTLVGVYPKPDPRGSASKGGPHAGGGLPYSLIYFLSVAVPHTSGGLPDLQRKRALRLGVTPPRWGSTTHISMVEQLRGDCPRPVGVYLPRGYHV